MRASYLAEGICFYPEVKGKAVELPISHIRKSVLRDPEWPAVNTLEQVYFQGLLTPHLGGYLLKPEDLYTLDPELSEYLPIPHNGASICLEENGNIGSEHYSISWYLLVRGRNAGRSIRRGCIASAASCDFLLTQPQLRLITELENWQDSAAYEDRARFQAKCKYLAGKAGVQLSDFTRSREFLFADRVEPAIEEKDAQHLRIVPDLPDLPEDISSELPDGLRSVAQIRHGDQYVSVFTSADARKRCSDISQIPEIEGQDIPRFVKNPLSFLPDTLEFDTEEFSKRVRGLKVRTASAVPYIRIEKQEGSEWFPASFGTRITDDGIDDNPEKQITVTPELEALLREGAARGEEYIYYDDTWIRIDAEKYRDHLRFQGELSQQDGNGHGLIRKADLNRVLDVLQNLEEIEYQEPEAEKDEELLCSPYPIPMSLHGTLKDYQKTGYYFLCSHYESRTGVLLADDMGLGKTVQVIAFLAYLYDVGNLNPALLIMPLSLIGNWKEELHKFLPEVRKIYVHQGAHRYQSWEMIREHEIVLTSYETLARDQELLGRIRWSCVVCDEAQKVKNFRTLAASAVKGMNTPFRIAVTGTPVENRLSELWSIVDFVQPGLARSYKVFRKNYEMPIQKALPEKEKCTEQLIHMIAPVFLRRKKEDVLSGQIPPKEDEVVPVELSQPQEKLYRTIVQEMRDADRNCALGTIQRLMMLCSHPRLLTRESSSGCPASVLEKESPKLAWTMGLLHDIRRKKEKVIIFTRFIAMQSMLRQAIYEEFHLDAPIINGEVKENRLDIIRNFENEKGFHVMILSPRAAGVGLNIVAANHVIHYTREWNPAVENQATDRVYRIGQTLPVTVYYPVMESPQFSTVEERLNQLLANKREIMKSVIIPSNLEIQAEEFYDLLQ